MRSFFSEFTRDLKARYTILVMDDEGVEQPRPYAIHPKRLLIWWGASIFVGILLMMTLILLTPLRELIPGYGTVEMRRDARLNALRLQTLQDSLTMQQQYMQQLRNLMIGQVDISVDGSERPAEPAVALSAELAEVALEPSSENWSDHQQPALPLAQMPTGLGTPIRVVSSGETYLSSLQWPKMPPVQGFFTRGFDARLGHYAIDIAAEVGSVVRSVGDGYVIFADWTLEGGNVITVQHADGYVSVYKHNQRLLKRVGDRVRDREAIAMSGNSGEITTGPHLHFELWHNGLAQDPQHFFIGI